MEILRTIS